MKKFAALLIISILITSICGCQKQEKIKPKDNSILTQDQNTWKNSTATEDQNSDKQIKDLFIKADNSVENQDHIESAFILLRELLSSSNDEVIPTERISNLSSNLIIHEREDSRIIEYMQSPELYGNSGRSSWKLFEYYPTKKVFLLEKEMPYSLKFFRIIVLNNEPILYAYETNFETNQHKVHIFSYSFNTEGFLKLDSIDFGSLPTNLWGFDKGLSMVWCKKSYSTYIDSVSEDGKKVVIKGLNDDSGNVFILNLKLNQEGLYSAK